MKNRVDSLMFGWLLLVLPATAQVGGLAPAALAGNSWYVDGVNGSDNND